MTTSGVTTFSLTALDVITEALGLLRVGVGGEPLSSDDTTDALRSLNMLAMSWKADGLHLWTKAEAVLFLVSGQASYGLGSGADHCSLTSGVVQTALSAAAIATATTITVDSITNLASGMHVGIELSDGTVQWTTISGAPSGVTVTLASGLTAAASDDGIVYAYTTRLLRPTRLLNARRRDASANTDIPVQILERSDYFEQPRKTQDATVTMVYYDPQLVTGQLYVWSTSASETDTIRFTFERPLEDFEALTDTADMPQEWLRTLSWNLAADLGPKHSFPLQELGLLEQKALAMKEKLLGFDREYGSMFFQPDFAQGGGYGDFA